MSRARGGCLPWEGLQTETDLAGLQRAHACITPVSQSLMATPVWRWACCLCLTGVSNSRLADGRHLRWPKSGNSFSRGGVASLPGTASWRCNWVAVGRRVNEHGIPRTKWRPLLPVYAVDILRCAEVLPVITLSCWCHGVMSQLKLPEALNQLFFSYFNSHCATGTCAQVRNWGVQVLAFQYWWQLWSICKISVFYF